MGLCLLIKVAKLLSQLMRNYQVSSSFSVKAGVHQESALSPLLFIMVMDVLTENMRDDLSTGFQLKVTSTTKLFFVIK